MLGRRVLDRPSRRVQSLAAVDGAWTEEPLKFDNSYFKEMLGKAYSEEQTEKGCPQHRNKETNTIMLISDLALMKDPSFRPHVETYATNQVSAGRGAGAGAVDEDLERKGAAAGRRERLQSLFSACRHLHMPFAPWAPRTRSSRISSRLG